MKCCANCIGDWHLRKNIFPNLAEEQGTCSFCESEDQHLVEPKKLFDAFGLIVGIYSPDNQGKTLVEWFKHDWAMFQHEMMDIAHAKELLAEILDDGDIVRQRFVPSELDRSNTLAQWKIAREELMHKNRFFPETVLDFDRLTELLPHLLLDPADIPITWYRARIQESDVPFPAEQMGAPPGKRASQGRANPAGIPYLYLASTADTAIAEIRPHTGEIASVAEVSVPSDLNIVDLRQPRVTVSPFWLPSENEVALLRGDLEFLVDLGKELTRPVLPQAAAIDYIPSQYICEFIKNRGHDGVMYRSSVGDGVNIALFVPECATVGRVSQHRVVRVSVEIDVIS